MEDASPSKSSATTEAGDNSSSSDAESWIVLDQDDVSKEEVNILSESGALATLPLLVRMILYLTHSNVSTTIFSLAGS